MGIDKEYKNIINWIWLATYSGISLRKKHLLIDRYKDISKIFVLFQNNVEAIGAMNNAEMIYKKINKLSIKICLFNETKYPTLLKKIYDPPLILYYYGTLENINKSVAVVGSRNFSLYGEKTTKTLVKELVQNKYNIISGLARGIDTIAHKECIRCGGKTIAVLGCGLNIYYPPENKYLYKEIVKNGAIISEYPPDTRPTKYFFPARNRIVSGLCAGTVIIEAGNKSGTLITAGQALEQGREVFAVPGNIDSMRSVGTNKLIQDGARLILEGKDIIEVLDKSFIYIDNRMIFTGLMEKETNLIISLWDEDKDIDTLIEDNNISKEELKENLYKLMLKGLVKSIKNEKKEKWGLTYSCKTL